MTAGDVSPGFRPSDTFEKSPDIVARHIAGELLLVPTARRASGLDAIFVLRGSAIRVWEMLERRLGFDEMLGEMARGYGMTESDLESDLRGFLSSLVSAGMVRLAGPPEEQ
ncbi:PqqD family protein [Candidatus Fermentibacterales bacterium]|nr:PqqD family protein [Candidatus Fermentibacterales bacterium]